MRIEVDRLMQCASMRPRSGRQNLAQGEANAASETLGHGPNKDRARFSGRQRFLSPAKAVSKDIRDTLLKTTAQLIVVVTAISLLACSRSSQNEGSVQSSRRPTEVKSSADAVSLGGTGSATTGSTGEANVLLVVHDGYHVNANPATFSYLIATEVTTDKVDGLEFGKPIYPPAEKRKFEFSEAPLAVYQGQVEIKLPFTATTKGERSVPYHVRVQACDNEKCFPPATLNGSTSVGVQ